MTTAERLSPFGAALLQAAFTVLNSSVHYPVKVSSVHDADCQRVRMAWVNLQRIHSERVSFVQPPGPSNQAPHCCSERASEVDYFLLCAAREKRHL